MLIQTARERFYESLKLKKEQISAAPCITKMVAMFQSPKAILQEN